ncbi:MAG: alpha/beta hydrolase [Thermodesulfobacteriota bacterium]
MDLTIRYKGHALTIACFLRPGPKETLVFLHGLGCSKEDFRGAAEAEGLRDYTLAGFDFPGSGGSSYPEGARFSLADLAEITDAVVAGLGLDRFVLAGHSMGGAVALLYMAKHPEKAAAFVNIEGNLAPDNCGISRIAREKDFRDFYPAIYADHIKRLLDRNNPGFAAWARSLENASPQAFFDYCPTLVELSDSGILLRQFIGLAIPKIYIYGSQNQGLCSLPELAQKGCPLQEIPASAHFPFHDNPETFYTAVSDFLREWTKG